MITFSIVVPTVGRPSLTHLLHALARTAGPLPERIVLVDDRPGDPGAPLPLTGVTGWPAERLTTLRSGGRGPAAARNTGWRAATGEWVVFLDDDVLVTATWLADLAADLAAASPSTGGVQGRISVPLPTDRRATDWERGTAGLEDARWITADMAYRRAVLVEVGGFDERFPRAFREDADLALRVSARHRLVQGGRRTLHPVRPAPWHASVGQQRGNADDVLMRRLHGPDWYRRAEASVGRRPLHLLTTALAAVGVVASVSRRHRRLGAAAAGGWLALTAQFAFLRIRSGPWRPGEVARMAATSMLIPFAATGHFLAGLARHRRPAPWPGGEHGTTAAMIAAVLVDRDGTLVHDVPYNTDPELVRPMDGVAAALDRLRADGVRIAVVTNQSGIARGLIDPVQLDAVNARVESELGPFAGWQVCPHGETEGCTCRKPAPGLLLAAAQRLGVPISRCAMIGDIGADLAAGAAAGVAISILVPTDATRPEEVAAARHVAESFAAAVDLLYRELAPGTAVPARSDACGATDRRQVSAWSSGARR